MYVCVRNKLYGTFSHYVLRTTHAGLQGEGQLSVAGLGVSVVNFSAGIQREEPSQETATLNVIISPTKTF